MPGDPSRYQWVTTTTSTSSSSSPTTAPSELTGIGSRLVSSIATEPSTTSATNTSSNRGEMNQTIEYVYIAHVKCRNLHKFVMVGPAFHTQKHFRRSLDEVGLPPGWVWFDPDWEMATLPKCDANGWVYAINFNTSFGRHTHMDSVRYVVCDVCVCVLLCVTSVCVCVMCVCVTSVCVTSVCVKYKELFVPNKTDKTYSRRLETQKGKTQTQHGKSKHKERGEMGKLIKFKWTRVACLSDCPL